MLNEGTSLISTWEFAGIYSDNDISGTMNDRPEFKKLLEDAKAGRIDLIITKSISRFTRNTVTLLEVVRELKSINVEVYFEEQNIYSMSSDGELMLSILASFAQEKARSVSENMKWCVKRRFENGLPWSTKLFGYRFEGSKFIVYPAESEVVKFVFNNYLSGQSIDAIVYKLNKDYNIKKWYSSHIYSMLRNYNYSGNLILQKTYTEDCLTKKTMINNDVLPQIIYMILTKL